MRSPWHHDPRIKLTQQKIAKLFLERGSMCGQPDCRRKLGASDDWIVEHILALENGGSNDWHNLGITCLRCKPIKDAADHGAAAKSRQSATRFVVSRSMRQTSFPCGRNSPWKKKLNGQIEER